MDYTIQLIILATILIALLGFIVIFVLLISRLNFKITEMNLPNLTSNVGQETEEDTDDGTPGDVDKIDTLLEVVESYYKIDSPRQETEEDTDDGTPGEKDLIKRVIRILKTIESVYSLKTNKSRTETNVDASNAKPYKEIDELQT